MFLDSFFAENFPVSDDEVDYIGAVFFRAVVPYKITAELFGMVFEFECDGVVLWTWFQLIWIFP